MNSNSAQNSRGPLFRAWQHPAAEPLLLLLALIWLVGPKHLVPGGEALGRPSRDLFDHIALLDAWFLRTSDWNFPLGGTLFPADPTGMLLSAPFRWLGLGAAYSWAVLLQLWLCALAGWALGRRVGSGLVAGAAFGLSPYLIGQAITGEAETLCAWPLAGVALLMERGGRKMAVAAGILAALGAVSSWYYGVFIAVYLSLFCVVRSRDETGWRADGLWAVGSFCLAVAWPAWVYLGILQGPEQLFAGPTVATYISDHPQAMIGMVSDPAGWFGFAQEGAAHTDLLGGVILVLAGWGAISMWREDRRGLGWWLGIVFLGLVLALGPVLVFQGSTLLDWAPGRLLADLPVLGRMRLSHRWVLLATLGLSVLAARGGRALSPLFALMIVLESAWFAVPDRPSTSVQTPEIHQHVSGPVLDLPARTLGEDARGRYLVWQRTHGQPIPYALLMQAWSPELSAEPIVIAVSALDGQDPISLRPAEARQFRQGEFAQEVGRWRAEQPELGVLEGSQERLRALGLAQVILHMNLMESGDAEKARALLQAELGAPAVETQEALLWDL